MSKSAHNLHKDVEMRLGQKDKSFSTYKGVVVKKLKILS